MSDDHFVLDDGLRHLSKLLVGSETLETTLQRITDVTERALPNTTGVSIALCGSPPRTAVATSDAVRIIDQRAFDSGDAPCIEAIETNEMHTLADAEAETRWPEFVRAARQEGIRSAIAVPLTIGADTMGALNVYASRADAFNEDHLRAAQLLAEQASVALFNAKTYDECGEKVRQLQEALESRIVIEQAKGVIMEREHCGPDAAFEKLKLTSQRANRKMRLIAGEVVESVVREA